MPLTSIQPGLHFETMISYCMHCGIRSPQDRHVSGNSERSDRIGVCSSLDRWPCANREARNHEVSQLRGHNEGTYSLLMVHPTATRPSWSLRRDSGPTVQQVQILTVIHPTMPLFLEPTLVLAAAYMEQTLELRAKPTAWSDARARTSTDASLWLTYATELARGAAQAPCSVQVVRAKHLLHETESAA